MSLFILLLPFLFQQWYQLQGMKVPGKDTANRIPSVNNYDSENQVILTLSIIMDLLSLAVIPRSNLEVGISFQKSLKSTFLLKTVKENTLMLPYFNNRKTNFSEIEKGIVR